MAASNPTYLQDQGRQMTSEHDAILREFQKFALTAATATSVMERICHSLHEKMSRYNWVGFYLIDPKDSNMLEVGPYVGSFTPNARIPLDTGLCGACASTGQTVIVHDVTADPRYLPGSSMVKSEIVVPIFAKKKLAGELDIESYFANTFTAEEREFAEACAKIVGEVLGRLQN